MPADLLGAGTSLENVANPLIPTKAANYSGSYCFHCTDALLLVRLQYKDSFSQHAARSQEVLRKGEALLDSARQKFGAAAQSQSTQVGGLEHSTRAPVHRWWSQGL